MSETQNEIQEIELQITELEDQLKRREILKRLMVNQDFKDLIEEDYMREEAIRLTSLLGSPNQQLDAMQGHIIKDLEGIAALRRYFDTIFNLANVADEQIKSHNATLDEIRSMADDTSEEDDS
jgi:hypothetical protein